MSVTKEIFLDSVKNHQMNILLDNGVFRCIEFRDPKDKGRYFFYLSTIPGRLLISGDCGTYVFSRINDMFQFFRGKYIDFSYWASKADAEDTRGGIRVFNVDKLKQQLTDNFNDFKDCWPCSKEDEEEFQEEILNMIEDEHTFVALGSKRLNCGFEIEPWEYSNVYDLSSRFIWNCYAINWGIDQYDKLSDRSETSDQSC